MTKATLKILNKTFILILIFPLFLSLNACSFFKKKKSTDLQEMSSGGDSTSEDSDFLEDGLEEEEGAESESPFGNEENLFGNDEETSQSVENSEGSEPEESSQSLTSEEGVSGEGMSESEESLENLSSSDEEISDEDGASSPTKKRTWVSVKKMAEKPFKKKGFLINAIYIVRPNDSLQMISQKIFEADKTDELLTINSHFRHKKIKVGDKIYYQSPRRPNDRETLLTYYEDKGFNSEVYVSSPGENIRTISKKLLGHSDSWKEIWATNFNVESKTKLSESMELRYWGSKLSESATVAAGSMEETYPGSAEPSPRSEYDNPAQMNEKSGQIDNAKNLATGSLDQNQQEMAEGNAFRPKELSSPPLPSSPHHHENHLNSVEPYQPPQPHQPSLEERRRQALLHSRSKGNKINSLFAKKNRKLLLSLGGIILFSLLLIVSLLKKKKKKKVIDFTETQI